MENQSKIDIKGTLKMMGNSWNPTEPQKLIPALGRREREAQYHGHWDAGGMKNLVKISQNRTEEKEKLHPKSMKNP